MDAQLQLNETLRLGQLIADTQITNYVVVAALTALIYDHMLSFQDEVELMWRRNKWTPKTSVIKIFYHWNRYFSTIGLCVLTAVRLMEVQSDMACRTFYWLRGTIAISIIASIDSVLVLRVWILYGRHRRFLFLFIPLMIAEITIMFLISHFVVPSPEAFEHIGPILPGCHEKMFSRSITLLAIPPFIVSFAMFAMTIYRCITTLRQGMADRMPIMSLFLRDGVLWFVAVLLTMGGTIVNWLVGRPSIVNVTNTPCIVILSLIASHALLNMKRIQRAHAAYDVSVSDYESDNYNPPSIIFRPLDQLSNSS